MKSVYERVEELLKENQTGSVAKEKIFYLKDIFSKEARIAINLEINLKLNSKKFDWHMNQLNGVYPCISMTGSIAYKGEELWIPYCEGQCYDEIEEILNDCTDSDNKTKQKLLKICRAWWLWHNNDLIAGIERQELAISQLKRDNKYTFDKAKEHLKSAGLYENLGYRYGSLWLYKPISNDKLKEICDLFE